VKKLSLFEQACKLANDPKGFDLGQISSISRKEFDDYETISFMSAAPGVEYAFLLIENALLLRTNRSGRIYAGFKKLSLLEPVIDRYLRIADLSEAVFIFGEPDWTPPRHPNMRTIPLTAEFNLSREWFLISDSPALQVAVVSHEQDGAAATARDLRTFKTIKTSNQRAVVRLARAAEGLVDWSLAA
jgi:DICT domain-containing protein